MNLSSPAHFVAAQVQTLDTVYVPSVMVDEIPQHHMVAFLRKLNNEVHRQVKGSLSRQSSRILVRQIQQLREEVTRAKPVRLNSSDNSNTMILADSEKLVEELRNIEELLALRHALLQKRSHYREIFQLLDFIAAPPSPS